MSYDTIYKTDYNGIQTQCFRVVMKKKKIEDCEIHRYKYKYRRN